MKKTLLLSVVCLMAVTGMTFAQTASFAFNDNSGAATSGTYLPTDIISLDVFVTADFAASGYSLWLQAPTLNGFNTKISITGETYFTFLNQTDDGFPKSFTSSSGASSGFLSDTDTVINPQSGTIDQGDLGATGFRVAGTYQVANLQFSLAGAPLGTYTLFTTTISPKGSEVSRDASGGFATVFAPTAAYTITIAAVPEPATWSLMGLGGLGALGLTWLRARRQS